jgi:hypothetical protein
MIVSRYGSRHARVLRRVISGEEVTEEEIGYMDEDDLEELIHNMDDEPEVRETRGIIPLARHTSDLQFAPEDRIIHVPIDAKTVFTFDWGGERFTVLFPKKGEGEVDHDLPVGRIEWIIEDSNEDD